MNPYKSGLPNRVPRFHRAFPDRIYLYNINAVTNLSSVQDF